jgi:hypothetical protein
MWWHTVTHTNGSEEENGEWSGLPVSFTLPRNMVYPASPPLLRTPRLPVVEWTDAPADLNALVHFAERWKLVSGRVPSHFKRSLLVFVADRLREKRVQVVAERAWRHSTWLEFLSQKSLSTSQTTFEMWWHTRRNQISSFGETGESI